MINDATDYIPTADKKIKNKNVKDDYVVNRGIELFGERFN